ncbi:hypothetical protein DPEC_G00183680 [Dallia pectoralis]|uniref:Uncharacterized protein n=1 Tax=Dallia pectoralis TaxID=75939 RepID=A0ACC2GBC3_DALPE|nr:hypothetical protein DPEC_G00183680 [Dallia pectoralis]
MVNYKVDLFTGDIKDAGTKNEIYIKLSGADGESDLIYIDQTAHRGSVIEYQVPCPSTLGQLEFVTLKTKPSLWHGYINDDWFCSKVVVITPEGSTCLFPVYSWITGNVPQVFREATGQWSTYNVGLPNIINIKHPSELPAEVRFSFTKNIEFAFTAASALVELKLNGQLDNKNPWKNLDEFRHVLEYKKTKVYEYVEKNWKKDEFFGYQFLNGVNPMMIKRCTELPENFPVTEDMVKASLSGKSLQEEMQDGNIFLVDYNRLKGLTANVINDKQHYLTAPLCLLYMNPEQKLMPIAIQLNQEPSEDNPIFLPTDSEYDWLLAKIFVRNADFAEHELNSHLLRTHLLAEVFAVSTLRNLPMVHPVYKLLISHIRYTLQINIMARESLISKTGLITMNAGIGGSGMMDFLKRAMAELTYSSLCMPEDITARGLDTVPNFFYRDDGLKLWKIILSFVQSVIDYYYTDDKEVENDSELQSWIGDIFENGFHSKASTGIPNIFHLKADVVKFLTMTIFTVSVQHAAVNNGQFDFVGWMPNSPVALQLPPPTTKGQSDEETMLQTFPAINTSCYGVATVYLLSKQSTDTVFLGDYPEQHFSEKIPLQKINKCKQELKELSECIKGRNEKLELLYSYLDPEDIEASVAL